MHELPLFGIGPGLYAGLLYSGYNFKGMTLYKSPAQYAAVKSVARFLLTLLLVSPFILFSKNAKHFVTGVYEIFFFGRLMPLLMTNFVIYGISDYLSG